MSENWFYISEAGFHAWKEEIFETASDRALFRWMDALNKAEDIYPGIFSYVSGIYIDQLRKDFKDPGQSFLHNFKVPVEEVPIDEIENDRYNHDEA